MLAVCVIWVLLCAGDCVIWVIVCCGGGGCLGVFGGRCLRKRGRGGICEKE